MGAGVFCRRSDVQNVVGFFTEINKIMESEPG